MSKEMFISSSPHETKVAVLDDDALVEVYFERDTDVGLVGGIYKGRVSRVLPGMQSAFVDIGLERDAFLYVSDFLEDAEEYDKIVADAEARVSPYAQKSLATAEKAGETEPVGVPKEEALPVAPAPASGAPEAAAPPADVPPTTGVAPESASAAPVVRPERPSGPNSEFRPRDHHGRRRRRRGGRFREQPSFGRPESRERFERKPTEQGFEPSHTFEILPGESLAKYSRSAPEPSALSETLPAAVETVPSAPAEPHPEVSASRAPEPVAGEPLRTTGPETAGLVASEPETTEAGGTVAASKEETAAGNDDRPRPLWNRIVSSVFGETREPSNEATPQGEPAGPAQATDDERPLAEAAESPAEHTPAEMEPEEASDPSALPEAGMPEAPKGAPPSEAFSTPAAVPAPPAESGEREYTLREPHQRPRFAPRRGRRGRRGRGHRDFRSNGTAGGRPEGPRPGNHPRAQISELLKEGQEILVQIAKEPLGRKGARITSHIALPGRYLVYMPTVDHTGVSRKIASEEERLRLRNVILENKGSLSGGFIVRTAAASQPEEELKADMQFLFKLWNDIRAKAEATKAPALLHTDLDLVQRLLRDTLSPDFKSVWLDSEIGYERVVEFVNRCQPSLVGHIKLYTRSVPLFEQFNIQPEIEKALKPKVWLKSGGYIVINQTEALVAIDVNTGKYVGKTNRLEDTIVKTNIDAVNEIVRQIRLRDLGGIIVIDFIDMDERRNRNKVVQALEEALRRDRAPTKLLSFNDFGLVAITRKRVKHSLERTLCEPCAYCSGSGWVKSVTTVCHEILAEARKMADQLEGDVATLRVNPEVGRALKSREGVVLAELESVLHKNVIVKGDPSVHQERFEIY